MMSPESKEKKRKRNIKKTNDDDEEEKSVEKSKTTKKTTAPDMITSSPRGKSMKVVKSPEPVSETKIKRTNSSSRNLAAIFASISEDSKDNDLNSSQDSSSSQSASTRLGRTNSGSETIFSPGFTRVRDRSGSDPLNSSQSSIEIEPEEDRHGYPMLFSPGHLATSETLSEIESPESSKGSASPDSRCTESSLYDPYNAEEDVYEEEEFDPYLFISKLPPPIPMDDRKPLLPPKNPDDPKITLVLDLDETLVHCSTEPIDNYELKFPVDFDEIEYQIYLRKRPFFEEFLKQVAGKFETVIFTASQEVYASKLLNLLDPDRRYIKHKVYRDSCVVVDGNYLKDLRVLGRDLKNTVIVDNSPQAFGYQLDNGIPILSWFDDSSDRELLNLVPILEELQGQDDVRPLLRKRFELYSRVAACQALN